MYASTKYLNMMDKEKLDYLEKRKSNNLYKQDSVIIGFNSKVTNSDVFFCFK